MKNKNDSPKAEVNRFKQMAREVIAHHFGSKPRRVVHKTSGLSNFVFAVDHPEGDLIVRLSPEPTRINSFIKEQWANNAAGNAGVPTAEILEVGNEIIGHPFMIMRVVEGGNALYHPERMKIISEMGRYAALINSIPTENFGGTFDWSSNQLSRNETWKDYLEKELKIEDKLQILERYRAVTPARIKQLREFFAAAAKLKFKPALNHGDLRLKNVIVDEAGKIKAFIDWEDCTSNLAPQWELSLALHDLWIDEKQTFLEGYNLPEKKLREISPLVKAFNIINYAPIIEHLAQVKDNIKLEQYRTRLQGDLDLYSL